MDLYTLQKLFPNVSKSCLLRNVSAEGKQIEAIPQPVPERKPRRAPKSKPLNHLESQFFIHAKAMYGDRVRSQRIVLNLAAGLKYTPDFYYDGNFFEVKGKHMWDDAWAKLKTAAEMFPEFKFWLVELINGGWYFTMIPPLNPDSCTIEGSSDNLSFSPSWPGGTSPVPSGLEKAETTLHS